MALSLEEASKVVCVDAARVVSVDGSEGGHWTVIESEFKAALEGIKSALQVDLLLDDLAEGGLNVEWKAVVSANVVGTTIKSNVSQVVVSAWEDKLEEILE